MRVRHDPITGTIEYMPSGDHWPMTTWREISIADALRFIGREIKETADNVTRFADGSELRTRVEHGYAVPKFCETCGQEIDGEEDEIPPRAVIEFREPIRIRAT